MVDITTNQCCSVTKQRGFYFTGNAKINNRKGKNDKNWEKNNKTKHNTMPTKEINLKISKDIL